MSPFQYMYGSGSSKLASSNSQIQVDEEFLSSEVSSMHHLAHLSDSNRMNLVDALGTTYIHIHIPHFYMRN
jgi:hypothetical protein